VPEQRRGEDQMLDPTRRKWGITLKQKIDPSRIRCSRHINIYKTRQRASEGEPEFMRSYATRPTCEMSYHRATTQHLTAEIEQKEIVVNYSPIVP